MRRRRRLRSRRDPLPPHVQELFFDVLHGGPRRKEEALQVLQDYLLGRYPSDFEEAIGIATRATRMGGSEGVPRREYVVYFALEPGFTDNPPAMSIGEAGPFWVRAFTPMKQPSSAPVWRAKGGFKVGFHR